MVALINLRYKVNMKTYTGNLVITKENYNNFKELVEVSGSIDVRENATLTAPKLEKSGYIYVMKNATLTAPKLEKSGSIDVRENATLTAPKLEKSGYIDVRENATLTAPKLEKSGYIYVMKNATLTAPNLEIKSNVAKINDKKYRVIHNDGIAFFVERSRTTKGMNIHYGIMSISCSELEITSKEAFVVDKDGFSAHAETLKEAIVELNFKIVAEKLKNDPIHENTLITDNYYRSVTGACKLGIKQWREQNNITSEEITAKELLPILEKTKAYGLNRFKKLIEF